MDMKNLHSRRQVLAFSAASITGLAAAAIPIASIAGSNPAKSPGKSLPSAAKPKGLLLTIESIDPKVALRLRPQTLRVNIEDIVSLSKATNIPGDYFFDVLTRQLSSNSAWDFILTIYNGAGDPLGSVTTDENGAATFTEQKLRFNFAGAF